MTPVLCSIVVSVYNEEKNLPLLHEEIRARLDGSGYAYELIFVDDGSTDRSAEVVRRLHDADPRVRFVGLTRNFGHEAAMLAGIDHAGGDVVVCIDGDLQHPPEMIPAMLEAWRAGNDVVVMARVGIDGAPWHRGVLSSLFYRLLNRLSGNDFQPNASDFFLVSRRVADILRSDYRERTRFLRAFVQSVGFRRTYIPFTAPSRKHGNSNYSLAALFNLSINAIFSFSNLPLRLGVMAGLLFGGFSLLVLAYSVVMRFFGHVPSGYTTIVALITLLFSVQFILTGIIGEYIGMLFIESKKRPIYLVDRSMFFEDGP
ncbi:MAG TPA: glycosyltransferase family 2 protein [Candidatus Deferrimicrobiaceae bacterium]